MVWKPRVTVAAIIEQDGKFLMVKENIETKTVYNQPAGHLEDNEGFVEAIIREVQEETAWQFTPTYITGIYRWRNPANQQTFVRVCFTGDVNEHHPEQKLDEGIISAPWLSLDELQALPEARLRSPMVKNCLNDYLNGNRYPLDIITEL